MTRPTPAMFDHAVRVYQAMKEEAQEETFESDDEEGNPHESEPILVYTGHLTNLFQKLELAVPYYTAVMKGLKALGCVEQLRRGGGNAESKWILHEAPMEEAWVDYEANKRASRPQGKLAAHEQKIQNLLERVQRIEEYLQTAKV